MMATATKARAVTTGPELERRLWAEPEVSAPGYQQRQGTGRALVDALLLVVGLICGRKFTTPVLEVTEKYPYATAQVSY